MKIRSARRYSLSIALLLSLVMLTMPAVGLAQVVAFLDIPDIQGESDDPGHRNWIEILSCDWGDVPPPRGDMIGREGERAGKLCFGNFSIMKPVDKSSSVLLKYCDSGQSIPEVRLELAGEKIGEYRYLVLRKVTVLSVRPGLVTEGGAPTEIVTFKFSQVMYR